MEWTNKTSVEIVHLLIQELGEFAQRASADFTSVREELEPWYSLPHPSGSGSLLTNKAASSAVTELTDRALRLRKLEARVSHGDLKKEIGEGLVQRFLNEKREIDTKQVDRLLSWAAKRAENRCDQFTYLYPVRFTFTDEPKKIDLGPVQLLWLRQFDAEIFRWIKSYLRDQPSGKKRQWANDHLRKALEYYKSYKWFAKVTVNGYDIKRAEDAAYDLLTSALDCLYFLIGRKATHRIEVGKFKIESDARALAWVDSSSSLTVQTSHGSLDAMGFRDGWSDDLMRSDVLETLDLIQTALAGKSDPRLRRPLASRFLDAARWFGEGVRDKQSFSKVVKYTTAIERLLVAGKMDDISETVSIRIADLTIGSDDPAEWEIKKAQVKRSYDLRSKLVHGSISPFSREVLEGVSSCGDLAEETLHAILHRLRMDGLLADNVTEKQYAEWFDQMRSWVIKIHAAFETKPEATT